MANLDDFNALLETIMAIPDEETKEPGIPVGEEEGRRGGFDAAAPAEASAATPRMPTECCWL